MYMSKLNELRDKDIRLYLSIFQIHYGDLTFAWNQSVASLDAIDV